MEMTYVDPDLQRSLHEEFWKDQLDAINKTDMRNLKLQDLPLARIKKIMKLDDNVKMISAEVPILFSKAAEIFIGEMTMRAWWCTEENKRRTLHKSDVALAASRYDQFDFLIDIVPREDIKSFTKKIPTPSASPQIQYFINTPINVQSPNSNLVSLGNNVHLYNSMGSVPLLLSSGTGNPISFNQQDNIQNRTLNNQILNPKNQSKLETNSIIKNIPQSLGHLSAYNNNNDTNNQLPKKLKMTNNNITVNENNRLLQQQNNPNNSVICLNNDANNLNVNNINNILNSSNVLSSPKPILFQVTHQQLESLLGLKVQSGNNQPSLLQQNLIPPPSTSNNLNYN